MNEGVTVSNERLYYVNIRFVDNAAGVSVFLRSGDDEFLPYKVGSVYFPAGGSHREILRDMIPQLIDELPDVEGVVIRGSNGAFHKKRAMIEAVHNRSPVPLNFVSVASKPLPQKVRLELKELAEDAIEREGTVYAEHESVAALRRRVHGEEEEKER